MNHEATSSFLYDLHKLQEILEETLQCHCIQLCTFKIEYRQNQFV